MRTERIGIRITKDLKKKLEVLAQKEHRSFSNYVEMVLIEKTNGVEQNESNNQNR
jgi:predicted transcriptional regulator